MLINCIIIDDEKRAIELLENYVSKIKFLHLRGSFQDAQEALLFLESNSVDLLFLDVNMPGLTGIELAGLVDPRVKIIFATAYSEYAIKGFEYNAVDFLLKPFTFEKFSKSILKLTAYSDIRDRLSARAGPKSPESNLDFILFKSGTSLYKIDTNSIKYFEKDGNYFKVVTNDKNILIRMNFKQLQQKLPSGQFARIHKSYIINLLHVEKIEINSVTINKQPLPIGMNFRSDLNLAIQSLVQKLK